MRGVTKLLSGLQETLGREINPHVYSENEFKKRIAMKDHFLTTILKEPMKPILGEISDYR